MAQGEDGDGRSLIFLIGFMGAGKTTVGELLARELDWEFADSDRLIETAAGMTIDRIFEEQGEGRFRGLEAGVLSELAARERIVVATGGGMFLGRAQRKLMKERGWTVWLDLSLATARERVGEGDGRPLWAASGSIGHRAVFEKRRASYALPNVRVDCGQGSPAEVARGIRRFFVDSGGKLVIDRSD
jgi:shikimate kinase